MKYWLPTKNLSSVHDLEQGDVFTLSLYHPFLDDHDQTVEMPFMHIDLQVALSLFINNAGMISGYVIGGKWSIYPMNVTTEQRDELSHMKIGAVAIVSYRPDVDRGKVSLRLDLAPKWAEELIACYAVANS